MIRAHGEFLARKGRLLSLYGGSTIILVWTLLRHITNGVNFDVVGQIGLADLWTQGFSGGAQLGSTNYLLKMPLYALVNLLHFISPMNRILLLAAVFNVATFILLFVLIEKILQLYAVKDRSWFYLAMAWFSTIYGGVAWADYANSRNLETVGGLLFVYLVLKYITNPRRATLAAIAITASVVFFADPLQLYVCGVGTLGYAVFRMLVHRDRLTTVKSLSIGGAIIAGFAGSKILFLLAKDLLPVSFLTLPGSRPALTADVLASSLKGTFTGTLQIFNADFARRPYGPNSLRELLNAVVLLAVAALIVKALLGKNRKKHPLGLLLSIIVMNSIVYIASGNALQPETSRYLIMVPIVAIISIALLAPMQTVRRPLRLQYGWISIIVLSSVLLCGALATNWSTRHSKDKHIYQTVAYTQNHTFTYALASRELGVTSTYFAQGHATILPLTCTVGHTLHEDTLFYDKGAFNGLRRYTGEVPIIMQRDGIGFGAYHCSQADIIAQFGKPKREQIIPGVGQADIYDAKTIFITD